MFSVCYCRVVLVCCWLFQFVKLSGGFSLLSVVSVFYSRVVSVCCWWFQFVIAGWFQFVVGGISYCQVVSVVCGVFSLLL